MDTSREHNKRTSHRTTFRIAALIAAGSFLSSCVTDGPDITHSQEEIRNGDAVADGYAEMAMLSNGTSSCSAVLITNSLAMTARHCIYDAINDQGNEVPIDLALVYPAANLAITYKGTTNRGRLVFWAGGDMDIAAVWVDRPFSIGGATTGWLRELRRTNVGNGTVLECYGYGNNVVRPDRSQAGYGQLRHSSNAVNQVSANFVDIDANDRGQVLLRGDSGGGCFLGQELVGVNSRSDMQTFSLLANVSTAAGWWDTVAALFSSDNAIIDGSLIRNHVGGIGVVYGNSVFWISSWDEYVRDWSGHTLHQTGPTNLEPVPRDGTLLRDSGTGEIDIFYGGARFHIPSMEEFWALGDLTANLRPAPNGSFQNMPRIPRDGVALRDRVTGEIDVMIGGRRWHVQSMTTYTQHYAGWPLYPVPAGGLLAIPYGGAIP